MSRVLFKQRGLKVMLKGLGLSEGNKEPLKNIKHDGTW